MISADLLVFMYTELQRISREKMEDIAQTGISSCAWFCGAASGWRDEK